MSVCVCTRGVVWCGVACDVLFIVCDGAVWRRVSGCDETRRDETDMICAGSCDAYV